MRISDDKNLKAIQAEFKALFPHLQLRFYKKSHGANEGSNAKEEWQTDLTVGDIRNVHNEEEVKINKELKVSELEQLFEDHLGLHVQVFRESTGGLWLQTTATDGWTLERQNEKAAALLLNL